MTVTDTEIVVRAAVKADVPEMVSILDRAFGSDDPFGEYMFPDPARRPRHQHRLHRAMLRHQYLPNDGALVATVEGRVAGVGLWQKPDHRFGPLRYLAAVPEFAWAMGSAGPRVLRMDATMSAIASGLPHFFGVSLAVAPDRQRGGVGRALLAHVMGELERAQAPMFGLCKDGNVAYYEAGGALRVGRVRLGRGGPEVNVMMWLPRSLRASGE
ncbi:GNAT family N-acetyltransferase [Nocardia higoensis]|uniref:GNAT family N-acetyltransferase n=1 Tax=Nocardia higoensis TaxID=228599 RepID=A0ABS0D5W4_9NOCA|nr:GNAT family N-acetyltransferase [Nocardia higoensis]MBF6353856.1 GNAT family N-acetyltransferase [Nocardia higoensis]